MEKIAEYRRVIHALLAEYRDFYAAHARTDVDSEIFCDDASGQYLLMRVGWRGETRVQRPLFYLRLKNGNVFIEGDMTPEGIFHALVEAGVAPWDVVLAFQPPTLRETPKVASL
ncbi:MAG: XisI protein [Armatimonadetes bacterium]|nr:XisI protein [Armatimonadota bacterium]